jgi:hypothetical protein
MLKGKGNMVLMPSQAQERAWKTHEKSSISTQDERNGGSSLLGQGPIECRERLGGLLKYYYREAA